jgi:hypothetical protein
VCHFITGTLPSQADPHIVRRIAKGYLLLWEPITNPSVLRQLDRGDTYYYTTRGMCDCGTALGSDRRPDPWAIERSHDRKVKELQKKGWSVVKIERWLDDRRSAVDRKRRAIEERNPRPSPEVNNWIGFINETIASNAAKSVGVLLHFYQGDLETERIVIGHRHQIALAELTPEFLYQIQQDELYEFVKKKAHQR